MRVPAQDASAADWLIEGLMGRSSAGVRVGEVVPAGFEAYARIFHSSGTGSGEKSVSWAEVAEAMGRVAHPVMEWAQIATPAPGRDRAQPPDAWNEPPTGTLPKQELAWLVSDLREFTLTPGRCWFCLWTGFGGIVEEGAQVQLPQGESFFLSTGPIEAAATFQFDGWWQSPSIWWPEDHSWCVGSNIDLMTTYVAASRACAERLLRSDVLEAMETSADARVDWHADAINRD